MFVCDKCDRTCPEQWRNRHEGESFCDDCYEEMDVEEDDDDDEDDGKPPGYGQYMGQRTPTWGSNGTGSDDGVSGPWGTVIEVDEETHRALVEWSGDTEAFTSNTPDPSVEAAIEEADIDAEEIVEELEEDDG